MNQISPIHQPLGLAAFREAGQARGPHRETIRRQHTAHLIRTFLKRPALFCQSATIQAHLQLSMRASERL